MATVAINGLGRIGRAALKIIMDMPGLDQTQELVSACEQADSYHFETIQKKPSLTPPPRSQLSH